MNKNVRDPVWDRIRQARARLQKNLNLDIGEVTATDLLAEPLGPHPDCLTPNDVAEFVALQWDTWQPAITQRKAHLDSCPTCLRSVELYRAVTAESRSKPRGLRFLKTIRVPDRDDSLEVQVGNFARRPILEHIVPESLHIVGPVRARDAQMSFIPPPSGACEATRIKFHHFDSPLRHRERIRDWVDLEGMLENGEKVFARGLISIIRT